MDYLFIVNPIAGGKDSTDAIRAAAASAFSGREDSYEIYVTKGPLDAEQEVRRRGALGRELRILSCGGDGTFNECANGAAGQSNLSVAPFPVGTGNDFCRMFGEEKKLYTDLPALLDGHLQPIDLIRVNARCSDCICSIGIDARIGTGVHRYTHLPFCRGKIAYVVSLIVELCRGLTQPMEISSGEFSVSGPMTLCCICNGQHYGGGFHPSLDARPDDGILDVFIVGKLSFFQLIRAFGRYISGRSDEVPELVTHLKTDRLSIRSPEELVINIDGEAQNARTAEISLLPHALNLIVPKGLTFFEH